MRFSIAVAIVIVTLPLSQVSGRSPVQKTWGKSGVSYEQYKTDAVDCAYAGYYRDITQDKAAVRFLAGWRAADTALNMPGGNGDSWGAAVARTQPDRRIAEINALQTADVETCLAGKGYRQIDLTKAEAKQLARFHRGSETRRRYLHAIATR